MEAQGGKGKLKCAGQRAGPARLQRQGEGLRVRARPEARLRKLPLATQESPSCASRSRSSSTCRTILGRTVTGACAPPRIGAITRSRPTSRRGSTSRAEIPRPWCSRAPARRAQTGRAEEVVLAEGAPTAGTAVFKLMGQKGSVELPSIAPRHPWSEAVSTTWTGCRRRCSAAAPTPPVDDTITFGLLGAPTRSAPSISPPTRRGTTRAPRPSCGSAAPSLHLPGRSTARRNALPTSASPQATRFNAAPARTEVSSSAGPRLRAARPARRCICAAAAPEHSGLAGLEAVEHEPGREPKGSALVAVKIRSSAAKKLSASSGLSQRRARPRRPGPRHRRRNAGAAEQRVEHAAPRGCGSAAGWRGG